MVSSPSQSKDNEPWRLPPTPSRDQLLDESGGDTHFRRMIYDIFTMTVNFDRIRESLAITLGLSGIQYHILMVVAELSPVIPVSISKIAERLHTSGPYVTMETKKLLGKGYLEKTPNPKDGRSVLVNLTSEGRELIESFAPELRDINDNLFEGIGPNTFKQFCTIVDHMTRTSTRAADLAELLSQKPTQEDTTVSAIGR